MIWCRALDRVAREWFDILPKTQKGREQRPDQFDLFGEMNSFAELCLLDLQAHLGVDLLVLEPVVCSVKFFSPIVCRLLNLKEKSWRKLSSFGEQRAVSHHF